VGDGELFGEIFFGRVRGELRIGGERVVHEMRVAGRESDDAGVPHFGGGDSGGESRAGEGAAEAAHLAGGMGGDAVFGAVQNGNGGGERVQDWEWIREEEGIGVEKEDGVMQESLREVTDEGDFEFEDIGWRGWRSDG
jgi:hypothetical protein